MIPQFNKIDIWRKQDDLLRGSLWNLILNQIINCVLMSPVESHIERASLSSFLQCALSRPMSGDDFKYDH